MSFSTTHPPTHPPIDYDAAIQAFFSSFKCYDEAGDPRRLLLLKYLVLASMLHASRIDPFDSQVRIHPPTYYIPLLPSSTHYLPSL